MKKAIPSAEQLLSGEKAARLRLGERDGFQNRRLTFPHAKNEEALDSEADDTTD